MSTISEVVDQQLASAGLSSYRGQADRVVRALEEREQQAVIDLIDFAVEQGLDHGQAVQAIREAGLSVPAPAAVDDEDSDSDTDARMARMERNIERLMDVARSRGLLS
jgi:hypothetical protein